MRPAVSSRGAGHWERVPYNNAAMRSVYHVREYNVRRLSLVRAPAVCVASADRAQLSSPAIFLSHDWPQAIEHHGDLRALLRRKPFFRADVDSGALGSPPLMGLLRQLKPQWWFAAHLHVRFEAAVLHEEILDDEPAPPAQAVNPDEIAIADDFDAEPAQTMNPDEITLDDEECDVTAPPPAPKPVRHRTTHFLALDKCLPRRQFLEVRPSPTSPLTPPLPTDACAGRAHRPQPSPQVLLVRAQQRHGGRGVPRRRLCRRRRPLPRRALPLRGQVPSGVLRRAHGGGAPRVHGGDVLGAGVARFGE